MTFIFLGVAPNPLHGKQSAYSKLIQVTSTYVWDYWLIISILKYYLLNIFPFTKGNEFERSRHLRLNQPVTYFLKAAIKSFILLLAVIWMGIFQSDNLYSENTKDPVDLCKKNHTSTMTTYYFKDLMNLISNTLSKLAVHSPNRHGFSETFINVQDNYWLLVLTDFENSLSDGHLLKIWTY